MKIKFLLPITFCALILTGCGTIDSALLTPTVNTAPAVTNQVATVSIDAATGEKVTNVQTVIVPATTTTNYAPNPVAVATTQAITAAPFPFAGTAGIAASWLLTAYAGWRTSKAKSLSAALVKGIEAGRQILQTTPEGQKLDAKVKDALIANQEAAGVLNAASALVNDLTGDTVKTPAA